MGGGTQDPDPAPGVLDHRQDVEAPAGQGDRPQEVAGNDRLGLTRRKLAQDTEARCAAGPVPTPLKDLPDGGGRDLDREHRPLAVNTPITPTRILTTKRRISRRIEATVRGRPTRRGRLRTAWRPRIRSRCHHSTCQSSPTASRRTNMLSTWTDDIFGTDTNRPVHARRDRVRHRNFFGRVWVR